jgi:hypothetical protein
MKKVLSGLCCLLWAFWLSGQIGGSSFGDAAALDATVSINNGSATHRLIYTRSDSWDSVSNKWIKTDSMRYFYTTAHLLDRMECYLFKAGKWEKFFRETYTYDINKNRSFLLRQTWDGTKWNDEARVIYAYDSKNNRLIAQNQSWISNAWKDVTRSLYEYDSNNNRTKWTRQKSLNNSWLNQLRYTYQYNGDQKRVGQGTHVWNINESVWENLQNVTYTLNAAGLAVDDLVLTWNGTNWENNLKMTHQYTNDGLLENTLQEIWLNSTWNLYWQNEYEYNQKNLVRSAEFQRLNNAWSNKTLYENTYDANNNQTYQRYATGSGNGWKNVQQLFSYYETVSGVLSPINTGLDFTIGPNPATQQINIGYNDAHDRLKTVRILDANGKLHFQQALSGAASEFLDVSKLPAGTYEVWVSTRQGRHGIKQLVKL